VQYFLKLNVFWMDECKKDSVRDVFLQNTQIKTQNLLIYSTVCEWNTTSVTTFDKMWIKHNVRVVSVVTMWIKHNVLVVSIVTMWIKHNVRVVSVVTMWIKHNVHVVSIVTMWIKHNVLVVSIVTMWMILTVLHDVLYQTAKD